MSIGLPLEDTGLPQGSHAVLEHALESAKMMPAASPSRWFSAVVMVYRHGSVKNPGQSSSRSSSMARA